MPNCCAYNCTNRFIKGSGITFHRFPLRDSERLRQWLNAVRRENFEPNLHTSICSSHFSSDCFYISSTNRRLLKEDAVPTIFDFHEHPRKERIVGKSNIEALLSRKMPNRCSIQGCNSNYDNTTEKFSTFTLPKDEELRRRWLLNIPTDFSFLKNPYVCEKHFLDSEVIRTDKVMSKGELKEFPRKYPKLKHGAIPTVFSNLPCLPTCQGQAAPKGLADVQSEVLENEVKEYEQNTENISSLKDIQLHLQNNRGLPKDNCTYLIDEEKITILFVAKEEGCPVLVSSIVIENSLEVFVYNNKVKMENDILSQQTLIVKDTNFLDNLMNFVEIHNF